MTEEVCKLSRRTMNELIYSTLNQYVFYFDNDQSVHFNFIFKAHKNNVTVITNIVKY